MSTQFITVTTKDVSKVTGKPKLFAINVARIVTVEPAMYDIAYDMDHAETIEGTCIHVFASDQHIFEIDSRDPFDHVMFRIGQAGGVIQQSEVTS
ncbi:gp95 [Mycobacterium phage Barnyard]|uniref:Uncharacterized protein n=1 Tax=Mycobacterium phage Barnyard TaxID=205880 RepID=Q855X7_9CAUD|nr:gp95 [Mycobacterium phage Barnyard]AAN02149.1 hypothetical protein PBI_BARNYARD_95 [Mycobacterium phage Barnyard]